MNASDVGGDGGWGQCPYGNDIVLTGMTLFVLTMFRMSRRLKVGSQVSFVGLTEEAAREKADKEGYGDKVAVAKTSFKANSKVRSLLPVYVRGCVRVHIAASLLDYVPPYYVPPQSLLPPYACVPAHSLVSPSLSSWPRDL